MRTFKKMGATKRKKVSTNFGIAHKKVSTNFGV